MGNVSPLTCCVSRGSLHPENDWLGPWDTLPWPPQVESWFLLLLFFLSSLISQKKRKNKSKVHKHILPLFNCVKKFHLLPWLSFLCPNLKVRVPRGCLFWTLASASPHLLDAPWWLNPISSTEKDDSIQAAPDPCIHLTAGHLDTLEYPKGSQCSLHPHLHPLSISLNLN